MDEMLSDLARSRTSSDKTIDARDICVVLVLNGWVMFDADWIPVAPKNVGDVGPPRSARSSLEGMVVAA